MSKNWIFVCFLVLFTVNQVSGQSEQVFKISEAVLNHLQSIVPHQKLIQLANLKGREFSEIQLSGVLQNYEFNDTQVKVLCQQIKFVAAVEKAAPIALLMHKIKNNIKQKLENIRKKDRRKKGSDEIEKLHQEFKKHKDHLFQISAEIPADNTESIIDILKISSYQSKEIEIISDLLLQETLLRKKITALKEVVDLIYATRAEIQTAQSSLKNAATDEKKKSFTRYLKELNARLEKTKEQFTAMTSGTDTKTFFQKEDHAFKWEEELKDIFSPIIKELKATTKNARKKEKLLGKISYYEERVSQIKTALREINKLLAQVSDQKLLGRLNFSKNYWEKLDQEFSAQLLAMQHQLLEEERKQQSILQSLQEFFNSFIRHRGKNLFYALLIMIFVYFIFRFFHSMVLKFSPLHRSSEQAFWVNLFDIVFYAAGFFIAITAVLILFYVAGDWLILTIVLLIVLGIIWGARNTLPQFYEQIRLLLGLGSVRHGEKIVIDNIPWQVEKIGFYSYLQNPLLTGGIMRMPLKDLIGMRSNPHDEKESWFPCKEGDYILINWNTWRRIILQTPQVIKFEWYEMHETMPTSIFLNQKIFNLSATPYWVGFSFEISYQHRFTLLDQICQELTKTTEEEVKKEDWAKFSLETWIDFEGFGDQSLILTYYLQMQKQAASKYPTVQRALKKIALKAANKHNLEIIRFNHLAIDSKKLLIK